MLKGAVIRNFGFVFGILIEMACWPFHGIDGRWEVGNLLMLVWDTPCW